MAEPPVHPPVASPLDSALLEEGARLLHAQCWLWGQDIRSPSGDLLATSGLVHGRFEGARSHRSHYWARTEGGRFVVPWSGGLLFGDTGGSLFLPRLRFAPVPVGARSIEDVPDLNSVGITDAAALTQHDLDLLSCAVDWLAAYEDGIERLAGWGWRRECARRWAEIEEGARDAAASVRVRYEPLAPLPDNGLAEAWRGLRDSLSPSQPAISSR